MRFEPREHVSVLAAVVAPVAGVAAALLLCSGLILWTGESVGEAYWLLLKGAFGTKFALTETLSRATPLILTGLAAAVAFRAKFWNIGADHDLHDLFYAAYKCEIAFIGCHQCGPQILVPANDKHNDENRGHHSFGQRQKNIDEKPHRSGTINAGRLKQLIRDRFKELSKKECSGSRRNERKDHASITVQ